MNFNSTQLTFHNQFKEFMVFQVLQYLHVVWTFSNGRHLDYFLALSVWRLDSMDFNRIFSLLYGQPLWLFWNILVTFLPLREMHNMEKISVFLTGQLIWIRATLKISSFTSPGLLIYYQIFLIIHTKFVPWTIMARHCNWMNYSS